MNKITEEFLEEYNYCINLSESNIVASDKNFDARLFAKQLLNKLLLLQFISLNTNNNYLNNLWDEYQTLPDQTNFYNYRLQILFNDIYALNIDDSILQSPSHHNIDVEVHDYFIYNAIHKLFNTFTFSLNESEYDICITPHILETIFEASLEIRNETGAFYTSKNIVIFMFKESIKRFLNNNSDESSEGIQAFVDNYEVCGLSDRECVLNLLNKVTIVDLACGAGAYFIVILEILAHLKQLLANQAEDIIKIKFDTIQNNIYGADINNNAIMIAKLRLWLNILSENIIIPYDSIHYNILCGDSICGESFNHDKQISLFTHESEEQNIINWQTDFPEIYRQGGFDIVISNPPYIKSVNITTNKDSLNLKYKRIVNQLADISCYFYIRGLEILKNNGIHVFICSNSWLYNKYGSELVKYIANHYYLEAIYESACEKYFTSANINTVISIIQKCKSKHNTKMIILTETFNESIYNPNHQVIKYLNNSALLNGNLGIHLNQSIIYNDIFDQYKDKFIDINQLYTVMNGINTGNNEFFVLTQETIDKYSIEPRFVIPYMKNIRNNNVLYMNVDNIDKFLFVCDDLRHKLQGTGALEYIKYGESMGYNVNANKRIWYSLKNKKTKSQLGFGKFVANIGRTIFFNQPVCFSSVFYIMLSNESLLKKLWLYANSSLFQLYINMYGHKTHGHGLLYFPLNKSVVLRDDLLPDIDIHSLAITNPVELNRSQELSDRIQYIDNIIFDALKLSDNERESVYANLYELIDLRTKKRLYWF